MRPVVLALLLATTAIAQNVVWIDLSGDWHLTVAQDLPEFAAPDFDDHAWQTVRLPSGISLQQRFQNSGWLRRKVELPTGTERRPLALTLGALQDVYGGLLLAPETGANTIPPNRLSTRLVAELHKRGPHRRRLRRRPIPGMLLHIDGSKHQWLNHHRWYDLPCDSGRRDQQDL